MKTYALIIDSKLFEIVEPMLGDNGNEIAIEDRFTPDFVAKLVDITDEVPVPACHWTYIDGKFAAPVVHTITVAEQIAINVLAIEHALDAKAAERGYSSIKSACAYASPTAITGTDDISIMCEKFRKEGNALQSWMGIVWATAYMHQAAIVAGTEPCPTVDEALALMPAFVWPV